MRHLTALLLAVTLVLAPMASSIASAMGYSGEHVHHDSVWHSAAEMAFAKAAQHAHDHGDHGDHDDDHDGGPIKHSHPEQVHAAAFVVVNGPQLVLPDASRAVAGVPATFALQQQPHPPFRPPQTA